VEKQPNAQHAGREKERNKSLNNSWQTKRGVLRRERGDYAQVSCLEKKGHWAGYQESTRGVHLTSITGCCKLTNFNDQRCGK